jgi:hypothetical protein
MAGFEVITEAREKNLLEPPGWKQTSVYSSLPGRPKRKFRSRAGRYDNPILDGREELISLDSRTN